MTPEGKVKSWVSKALTTLPCLYYKFMPVQTGLGIKTLDYLLVVGGRFVAIETKAPGKKMTPLQDVTAQTIRAAGGLVFLVDNKESLETCMGELRRLCGP